MQKKNRRKGYESVFNDEKVFVFFKKKERKANFTRKRFEPAATCGPRHRHAPATWPGCGSFPSLAPLLPVRKHREKHKIYIKLKVGRQKFYTPTHPHSLRPLHPKWANGWVGEIQIGPSRPLTHLGCNGRKTTGRVGMGGQVSWRQLYTDFLSLIWFHF